MAPITEMSGPVRHDYDVCRGRSIQGPKVGGPRFSGLPGPVGIQRSQRRSRAALCVTAGSWSSLRGRWSVAQQFAALIG